MATTLADPTRNAASEAVVATLNGGTLEFQASDNTVLATLTFAATAAAGSATAGTVSFDTITGANATAAGTIAKFVAKTSGGAASISGTVSTVAAGTGDITITDTVVSIGSPVAVTSMSFTTPAS